MEVIIPVKGGKGSFMLTPQKLLFLASVLAVMIFLFRKGVLFSKGKIEQKKVIDATDMSKDPVCGTYVEEGADYRLKYYGKVYYFCSQECLDKFKEIKKAEA